MMSVCLWVLVFFFKQKTAYELSISDWSSDVCSSDLLTRQRVRKAYLLQSDQLRTLLPDLLAEVEGALQSSALRAFGECRQRFRSALHPLYMKPSAAAFHDSGVLEWDEELIDYSRVETTPETDDGDEPTEHRAENGRADGRE